MTTPDAGKEFGARVERRVKELFGGNVLKAATAIGVPNATLARIIKGNMARMGTLQQLARGLNTTTDWLLSGAGGEPDAIPAEDAEGLPVPESFRYAWVLDEIGVPPAVAHAAHMLPASLQLAALRLMGKRKPTEAIDDAIRQSVVVWLKLITALRDALGDEALRASLVAHHDEMRLGFSPVAETLLQRGQIAPADLADAVIETDTRTPFELLREYVRWTQEAKRTKSSGTTTPKKRASRTRRKES